jgi:hypothetical protein
MVEIKNWPKLKKIDQKIFEKIQSGKGKGLAAHCLLCHSTGANEDRQ